MCGIKGQPHKNSNSRKDVVLDALKSGKKLDLWCLSKCDRRALRNILKDVNSVCVCRGSGHCNGCQYDGICGRVTDLCDTLDHIEDKER